MVDGVIMKVLIVFIVMTSAVFAMVKLPDTGNATDTNIANTYAGDKNKVHMDNVEMPPCSARYPHKIEYDISPNDVGIDPKKALSKWHIHRWWGLKERVSIVNDGAGKMHIRVRYPKGSINPSNKNAPRGGAGFYFNAGFENFKRDAACLRYRVRIPTDFSFGRGGKLPGLYGGKPPSGCKKGAELEGFSTRYMWRREGKGTLYAYLPGKQEKCGKLIGYGKWSFAPGHDYVLEQEILLNSVNSADGVIRVWVNGKLMIDEDNAIFRQGISDYKNIKIKGVMFNSFFGGKDPTWASPKDQHLDFSEFSVFFPTAGDVDF